jgi:HK97 family phage portal protein
MAWWNTGIKDYFSKTNPAQNIISREAGSYVSTTSHITFSQAYDKLEVVCRGVNMIVSACSSLDYDVKNKENTGIVNGVKQKTLVNMLNFAPNPYMSAQEFRTHLFTDFLLEGNMFIYYDGVYLYHLPAAKIVVHPDPKTFVNKYTYNSIQDFTPDEIIHIKDLSGTSVYRGTSRLMAAERSMKTLYKMQDFQDQFFVNGAIAGIVIETENTLSQAAKDRTIANWQQKYNTSNGAKRPMLLDSGLKLKSIGDTNFKDMDFDNSITTHNNKILTALGVPTVLLDGGNNANISPNLRLFYLETVVPIATRLVSALERYFGYDVQIITSTVSALQPEMKDVAAYHVSLVNGGIETPAEAREFLRLPIKSGLDDIRVPANIAGSAVNPGVGGAPPKPKDPPAP